MIKLENVSKTYKGRNYSLNALKNINLEIDNNEFVSIIGKSGSGKSTLMKIIGLLDNDYSGTYYFDNIDIKNKTDNEISITRRDISFVFQDFQLINKFTVYKNIELAYLIKYRKSNKEKILQVIENVGLSDKKDCFPDELSGGQKQRVSIARALVTNPKVIIADEPTGALDEKTSQEILDLLISINRKGTTMILVTHDNDIAKMSDRILTISNGEVME